MIRRLYNLEDWLFYRSKSCGPSAGRLMETWSRQVGQMADRLQTGLRQGSAI
jgi:hypothetical protein